MSEHAPPPSSHPPAVPGPPPVVTPIEVAVPMPGELDPEEMPPETLGLLKALIMRVPGATPDQVLFQLNDSLREFTTQAPVWTQEVELRTFPGASDYHLSIPCQSATAMWILSAWDDRGELGMEAQPYFSIGRAMARDNEYARPSRLAGIAPGLIRLYPTPDGEYPVFVTVTLVAGDIKVPVPRGFYTAYYEALFNGALHRLYAIPGVPWASTALATFCGRRFRSEVVDARITHARTFRRGLQPVFAYPRPAAAIRS